MITFVATLDKVDKSNGKIIWGTTKIAAQAVKMELDTRSALSIIPFENYKQMFQHIRLEKTEVTLKTCSCEKITPNGIINIPVQYNHQTKSLPLFVLEMRGPAYGDVHNQEIIKARYTEEAGQTVG